MSKPKTTNLPTRRPKDHVEVQPPLEEAEVTIGQWYWVGAFDPSEELDVDPPKEDFFFDSEDDGPWLGCAVAVGSNYVEVKSVYGASHRFLFDEMPRKLRLEPDPQRYIQRNVTAAQRDVRQKMAQVQAITQRLGVQPTAALPNREAPKEVESTALILSANDDVKQYEHALTRAREKDLPKLFDEIKAANRELAAWSKADMIPLEAVAEGLRTVIEPINDRIFNISIYAGLMETVERVRDGEPAGVDARLHVHQRRCYMDEECLANYRLGGIDIKGVESFDRWLSEPENLNRILPEPRCLVGFRVRRWSKEYKDETGLPINPWVKVELDKANQSTFLYIRNGDRLYRLNTELEFGPKLFPDRHNKFTSNERLWAKVRGSRVDEFLVDAEYQARVEKRDEELRKYKAWKEANPDAPSYENPHERARFSAFDSLHDFHPYDPGSVYYDDIQAALEAQARHYNRIALIIQGLYDRSEVLHPHPPVKTWTPEGFDAAVELVYADQRLEGGPPPDFDAYRHRINESLAVGSLTLGQDDYWARCEAEKENERRRNDWRLQGRYYPIERYRPHGNPGPGHVARIVKWQPRARRARFEWTRERQHQTWEHDYGDPIPASIVVPADKLFAVEAYAPGDFRQFFDDPRTRQHYLRWAPLLLDAEEFHAGNLEGAPD